MRHSLLISMVFLAQMSDAPAGESANYSTSLETFGSSAGLSSSRQYKQHAEAGAESVSTSSAGTYVVRHGFAGQIARPLAITFTNEDIADEMSLFQIQAVVMQDDLSYLVVPGIFAYSHPAHPVILSISPGGLVEFGAVHEETPVLLRAGAYGLEGEMTVHVRDTDADNYGSYAGDGLNDGWQVQHFGLENPSAAAGADPDGDGDSNLFEFHAQLVPTDPASRFWKTLHITGNTARITYGPIMPGTQYRLLTSATQLQWTPLTDAPSSMEGNMRTVTDPHPVEPSSKKFYRIEVARP